MNAPAVEYRRSKASRDAALGLAGMSLVLALVFGVLLTWRSSARGESRLLEIWLVQAAWAGVVVAISVRSWRRNVPMLRLDADGVREVRGTFTPWSDVASVAVERHTGIDHLVLTLRPTPPPTSIWKRSYGLKSSAPSRQWFALHHLDASPAEILAEAERWYGASGAKAGGAAASA